MTHRRTISVIFVGVIIALSGLSLFATQRHEQSSAQQVSVSPSQGPTGPNGATGSTGGVGPTGPAGVNAVGAQSARTVAFATAYQASDPTRPAFVQIEYSCTASIALGSPQTNTVELRIGPTNVVATGGGARADVFSSSLSVSVLLTVGWTAQGMLKANLPAGYYFAPRVLTGSGCTILSAADQTIG